MLSFGRVIYAYPPLAVGTMIAVDAYLILKKGCF